MARTNFSFSLCMIHDLHDIYILRTFWFSICSWYGPESHLYMTMPKRSQGIYDSYNSSKMWDLEHIIIMVSRLGAIWGLGSR